MNTYIYAYKALIEPKGTITGRIEARNGYEAERKVHNNNLMVKSVSVNLLTNQAAARKQKYEV